MATSVLLNGTSYLIPAVGESGWGTQVSNFLIAIPGGVLTKTGGAFTLTTDVDFGSSFGLKSVYYKSRGVASSAGILRLANTESIGWRTFLNDADKLLKVNASNQLEFDGNPLVTLALGAANTVLSVNAGGTANQYAKIIDANVSPSAAIAYSKLDLIGSIVNGDVSPTAGIVYSKLNLGLSIVNADINASAAIDLSKLATVTASKALISSGAGVISASTTTDVELGYVHGVTSAIQTQMDTKAPLISPTLVTPVLGVATATSINGTSIPSSKTLVVTTDTLAALASTTSLQLKGVISDETGSGSLVFADTPTLITPVLGVATATSINSTAIPSSKTLVVTTDKLSVHAATSSLELKGVISDETGSGSLVFADTPTLITPVLGVATATSINSTSIPSSKTLVVTTDKLSVHAATTSAELAGVISDETGSGALTFATAPSFTTEINMLAQAPVKFQDDAGGEYVALQAPTGVTTHTLKLPATQGAASTVLANDGSGNLSWAAATSTTLTSGNMDIGNGSNVRTATNTALVGDISATTASQSYTVTSASPGVFTVAVAPATGETAYVTVTQNGFTANTKYFVTNVSGTTFKLATTLENALAGTNITSSGTTAGVVVSGGLSLTSGVKGKYSSSAIPVGYVGAVVYGPSNKSTGSLLNMTSATPKNLASVALPHAGTWMLIAQVDYNGTDGSTAPSTSMAIAISTANNNVVGCNGNNEGIDYRSSSTEEIFVHGATAQSNCVSTLVTFYVASAATTLYLNSQVTFTGNPMRSRGGLQAVFLG